VETVEALGKFLPDVDRPNEGVFAWQDEDEKWLALRYDLTAPLARVYAQHRNDLPTPYRRYAMGPVWRNEKPGPGRFRQFYQCDADTVGTSSMAADAEMCMMLADALEEVGIKRGDYTIRVSSRKLLEGLLNGLNDSEHDPRPISAPQREIVFRSVDKLDKIGIEGVRELLGKGRRDASGDYTVGADLSEWQCDRVVGLLDHTKTVSDVIAHILEAQNNDDQVDKDYLQKLVETQSFISGHPLLDNPVVNRLRLNELHLAALKALAEIAPEMNEGISELEQITEICAAQGYGPDRIVIDPSVVRGLGYYTGPVFEAELTFEITDEKGRPRQFGSVAGGGRYDDLVARFTGQKVPAVGVSIGVDRLLAALHAKGRAGGEAQGPVVVTVMDRARMAEYQAMVGDLRRAGIRAEVYLGNPKNFGNQMKYADRRGSPVAIIAGEDEFKREVVQVKDLILGAQIAQNATLEEWKDRPSQYEVSRDALVDKVRAILAGQA
jgi:histidyl-tRNA synthetase